jgi:transposase
MTEFSTFVGIDVSKRRLDVAVHGDNALQAFENSPQGHRQLLAWLATLPAPVTVGCEASGGYERDMIETVSAQYHARVMNPARVHAFARALGRAKNDRLDARTIAHFAKTVSGAAVVINAERHKLGELMGAHQLLSEDLTKLRHFSRQLSHAGLRRAMARRIKQTRADLAAIAALVQQLIRSSPELRRQDVLLRSVPGIGPVISAGLLAWVPELAAASRRQIASLVGLAPFDDDSAGRHGVRHIKGGRKEPRSLLYMGALVACRHNPTLQAAYRGLIVRGKRPKVALIAIARKLLTLLGAILQSGKPWEDRTGPQPVPA